MRLHTGPRTVGSIIDNITKPIFKKHGFANQKVIAYWPEIVGNALAQFTLPQKIVFPPNQMRGGVLYIGVTNPGFSLEIQAQESRIVEKIAVFFGYQAISRIKVVISRFTAKAQEAKMIVKLPITSEEQEVINRALALIEDEQLRNRLRALADILFILDQQN